ncbi:MBL fold metallo-hydrolase [Pyxidicoccus sp. 3LG]
MKDLERARVRQRAVLTRMLATGAITGDEHARASRSPCASPAGTCPPPPLPDTALHFTDYVVSLHGPPPAKRLLHQAVHLGLESLAFPIEIHEVKDGDVVRRGGYAVHAVGVDHRINALAYALVEDDRPGRFNLEKARELGVPEGPSFGKLQRGEAVTLADGRTVKPEDVLGASRLGRRLVISGDTRPCASVVKAARDADLLVHESTFSDDEQERALETRHSTAREAARVAREAGARRLVLTHLSSRHDTDPGKLLAQAREEYKGPVEVAFDGLTVELPLRD